MLDLTEETKLTKLKALCVDLKIPPPPEIMIGMKVHDKNGVLIFDDVQRGHSWTRNFYNSIYSHAGDVLGSGGSSFGAGNISMKSILGNVDANSDYVTKRNSHICLGYGYHNNLADASFGIVVGTGDTAFDVDQYALDSIVAHGNGANQLAYTSMSAPVQSYNSGTKTWKNTISRILNNNSGGSINIKEVGLYWIGYCFYSSNVTEMLERSVLSPTVPVDNGAQLTVSYEISQDFSAID
jgi:hypothetical protein